MEELQDKIMTKKLKTFFEIMVIATKLINLDKDRKLREKDEKNSDKKVEKKDPSKL